MVTITGYAVNEVTGVAPFDNVLQLLQDFGFFRVVLPFLLVFAVFYAVLVKTGVLGRPSENPSANSLSAIVALVAAFFVIAYTPVVDALAVMMPQASFLLIVILLFLMLMSFILPNWDETLKSGKGKKLWWVLAIFFIFIMVAIVGGAAGSNIPILSGFTKFVIGAAGGSSSSDGGFTIDSNTLNLIIGLLIALGIPIVVIIIVIAGGGKGKKLTAAQHKQLAEELEKKEKEETKE